MLCFAAECQSVAVLSMEFRSNKPLRSLGIYKLRQKTLVLLKRSDELYFLFSPHNWFTHGPVDFRVSHRKIYARGQSTGLADDDLEDTGMTASRATPATLATLVDAFQKQLERVLASA